LFNVIVRKKKEREVAATMMKQWSIMALAFAVLLTVVPAHAAETESPAKAMMRKKLEEKEKEKQEKKKAGATTPAAESPG